MSKSKALSIPVVVRTQDNGDGGYSIYIYNNEEELLADHPAAEDGPLTAEMKREILEEDDSYTNGYITHDTLDLLIDEKGKITLNKNVRFHAGQ